GVPQPAGDEASQRRGAVTASGREAEEVGPGGCAVAGGKKRGRRALLVSRGHVRAAREKEGAGSPSLREDGLLGPPFASCHRARCGASSVVSRGPDRPDR